MPRTCTVCSRKDRRRIDAAIVAGGSNRAIAGRFGITRSSVQRHKQHASPAVEQATGTQRGRRRTPGRPTKFTQKAVTRICEAVAMGCSREAAAGLAGISAQTLFEWARKKPQFSDALQKADSVFEGQCIRNIRVAGKDPRNWTANAWALERRFPQRWGRIDRHLIKSEGEMHMPPPEEYVKAVARALGLTGEVVPIRRPDAAALPEARALPQGSVEIVDSKQELPVLPQDEDPEAEGYAGPGEWRN